MPYDSVDPSALEGDDLIRWYRRTPWEIEQERQAARLQQYSDFFGSARAVIAMSKLLTMMHPTMRQMRQTLQMRPTVVIKRRRPPVSRLHRSGPLATSLVCLATYGR